MYTIPLQFSDVIYNAANQTFEALVTVHDQSGARRYACAISAPIDMEFEDAAKGLSTQAMRRHGRRPSVKSRAEGSHLWLSSPWMPTRLRRPSTRQRLSQQHLLPGFLLVVVA